VAASDGALKDQPEDGQAVPQRDIGEPLPVAPNASTGEPLRRDEVFNRLSRQLSNRLAPECRQQVRRVEGPVILQTPGADLVELGVAGEPLLGQLGERRHLGRLRSEDFGQWLAEFQQRIDLVPRQLGGFFAGTPLRFPPALVIDEQPPRSVPLADLNAR
jgi:hypothetical protein